MRKRMESLAALLDRVDSRLLVLAAILFASVIFSLFKVVGAFSGQTSSPTYRNTPAAAFVPPASSVLVDPTYLEQPRLPDADFIAVATTTRSLMNAVANLTVTPAQLQAAGLSSGTAQATVTSLQANNATLQGRQFSVQQAFTVTPGGDANSAVVGTTVQYSSGQDGSPPVTATMSFSYARGSNSYASPAYGQWQLQSVVLTVENGASTSTSQSSGG